MGFVLGVLYDVYMNKTKWIIFAIIVVALFGGILWLNKSNEKTFTGDPTKIVLDGPIADHVFGTDAQKVTLIEYGDYQCPACGAMHQSVKDITTDYRDKLTFIFRNFPLTSIHPNALASSASAEAAGLQGKFWEMHDALYQTQQSWSSASADQRTAVFEGLAGQLGLDQAKFKSDLTNKDIGDKISRDRSIAGKFSVSQTPTFTLNGKKLEPSISTNGDALRKAVEDALASAYPGFTPVQAAAPQTAQ